MSGDVHQNAGELVTSGDVHQNAGELVLSQVSTGSQGRAARQLP